MIRALMLAAVASALKFNFPSEHTGFESTDRHILEDADGEIDIHELSEDNDPVDTDTYPGDDIEEEREDDEATNWRPTSKPLQVVHTDYLKTNEEFW